MGVKRAIKIAEETGRIESGPVYIINEIVHNDAVVRQLAEDGVGTVLSVADAPDGTVIISAPRCCGFSTTPSTIISGAPKNFAG